MTIFHVIKYSERDRTKVPEMTFPQSVWDAYLPRAVKIYETRDRTVRGDKIDDQLKSFIPVYHRIMDEELMKYEGPL